jgi:hypothetical protein
MALVRSVLLSLVLVAGCHRASTVSGGSDGSATRAPLRCGAMQSCTDGCAAAGDACVQACVARLTALARPFYDALAACVAPACAASVDGSGATPCRAPGSFACKMCVLARCPAAASACVAH